MTRKRKQKKKQHQKTQAKRGRRYELTDEAFERIEPLLPTQKPGGHLSSTVTSPAMVHDKQAEME